MIGCRIVVAVAFMMLLAGLLGCGNPTTRTAPPLTNEQYQASRNFADATNTAAYAAAKRSSTLTSLAKPTTTPIDGLVCGASSPWSSPECIDIREPVYPDLDDCDLHDCEPDYCEVHDCSRDDYDPAVEAEAEIELTAEAQTQPESKASFSEDCSPAYPDFCIPPLELVGNLDCDDIDGSYFTVYAPDPHWFDDDFDGIGCELLNLP